MTSFFKKLKFSQNARKNEGARGKFRETWKKFSSAGSFAPRTSTNIEI